MQNKMKGKIFNAQKVKSIMSGDCEMFREVVKNKTSFSDFLQTREAGDNWYKDRTISMRGEGGLWGDYTLERFVEKFCPYRVGQKIFVKEAFDYREHYSMGNYERYTAWKKRPAQHMKQEHSRLTLQIKSIGIKRLQDISEEDCLKSGVRCLSGSEIADTGDYFESEYYFGELEERIRECGCDATIEDCDKCVYDFKSPYANTYDNPFEPFTEYWNATHKKPEEKFEADPWVFVYNFEVVKCF